MLISHPVDQAPNLYNEKSELCPLSVKSLNKNRRWSEGAGTAGEPVSGGARPSCWTPTGEGSRRRRSGVKVHRRGWRTDQEQSCESLLLQMSAMETRGPRSLCCAEG